VTWLAGVVVAVALCRGLKRAVADAAVAVTLRDRVLARAQLGCVVREWQTVGDTLHEAAARATEPRHEARSAA